MNLVGVGVGVGVGIFGVGVVIFGGKGIDSNLVLVFDDDEETHKANTIVMTTMIATTNPFFMFNEDTFF